MLPEVSIVTPVYNGEKFLEEYFESILAQTFQNWECIVVSDGSTDNTLNIIEKYANQDSRILYHTIPNSGAPKLPRDIAISKTIGHWILPLDADDWISDDYLEKMIGKASKSTADIILPIVASLKSRNTKIITSLPVDKFLVHQELSGKDAFLNTLFDVKIGRNGAFIRKFLYKYIELADLTKPHLNFYLADEYDFRVLLLKTEVVAFSDAIYYYRQHAEALTKKATSKSFIYLTVDNMLEKLTITTFGQKSNALKQMQKHRILGFVSRIVLWMRTKSYFTVEEKEDIKRLLKQSYKDMNKKYFFYPSVWMKVFYFGWLQFRLNS